MHKKSSSNLLKFGYILRERQEEVEEIFYHLQQLKKKQYITKQSLKKKQRITTTITEEGTMQRNASIPPLTGVYAGISDRGFWSEMPWGGISSTKIDGVVPPGLSDPDPERT